VFDNLKAELAKTFTALKALTPEELCGQRYQRFRQYGVYAEG